MRPVDFPEKTLDLQKPSNMTDEQCAPLAVFRDSQHNSTVSCWRPTWGERLSILLFGRVWLGVHAGGETQPPVWLSGRHSVFIHDYWAWARSKLAFWR